MMCSGSKQVLWWPKPWLWRLAFETWIVTCLAEKELELDQEVEQYWLDIVSLASTQSVGFGTLILERGWTLCCNGVAHGERQSHV